METARPTMESSDQQTCRLAASQQQVMDMAASWYAKLFRQLQEGGISFNYNPMELQSLAVAESASVCWCGRQFGCVKALAMHQWQVYQQHAPEFRLVKDLICPWRLKNFWAVARTRQNLAYIPRRGGVSQCYQQLMQRGVQQEELIIDDAEIRLEATAVQGPKLPNALPGESELLHARDQLQWLFTSKLRK